MKTNTIIDEDSALAASYDDEPTFAPTTAAADALSILPAPVSAGAPLARLVTLANTANQSRTNAEAALVKAGRAHLAFSCLVGACVEAVYQQACKNGVSIKPLFRNYYKEKSRAAKLAGGCVFEFTYEHGNKCRKTYNGIRARMLSDGGYTPESLERVIAEHIDALIAGAYGEDDSLQLFGPFLSTDSLRQEMLSLFPQPAPTAGETVSAEVANGQPQFVGWDAQREHHKTEFLGYLTCIDTYINNMCMFTTKEDREEQAQRLELAARRLRAAKTQPNLPGLPE